MGIEVPVIKDFDITLPNGKLISARVDGSKAPVPQPVKAAPVSQPSPATEAELNERLNAAVAAITEPAKAAVADLSAVKAAHESSRQRTRGTAQRQVNAAENREAAKAAAGGKKAPTTMARRA